MFISMIGYFSTFLTVVSAFVRNVKNPKTQQIFCTIELFRPYIVPNIHKQMSVMRSNSNKYYRENWKLKQT
jgi:hypothetical protein